MAPSQDGEQSKRGIHVRSRATCTMAFLYILIINGGYVMDINGLLLGWSMIATCAIGYYQWKANVERRRANYFTILLLETVSGDVKPLVDGNKYTITINGLPEFSFERKE